MNSKAAYIDKRGKQNTPEKSICDKSFPRLYRFIDNLTQKINSPSSSRAKRANISLKNYRRCQLSIIARQIKHKQDFSSPQILPSTNSDIFSIELIMQVGMSVFEQQCLLCWYIISILALNYTRIYTWYEFTSPE